MSSLSIWFPEHGATGTKPQPQTWEGRTQHVPTPECEFDFCLVTQFHSSAQGTIPRTESIVGISGNRNNLLAFVAM